MKITHYDLFAGIGGFSLALEEVFDSATIRHIFCEWESFPTAVLRQHWPDGEFYGDIKDLVDHTEQSGLEGHRTDKTTERRTFQDRPATPATGRDGFTIVTGGFPCQPFSHAGRRKGTADDRYQWPNMFAVIRNTKPEWVIAENVRGLVTWNDGLVLETVCSDLEAEGYEVQPFIIPAVAVGAPHRRDRVWIIGRNPQYAQHARLDGAEDGKGINKGNDGHSARQDELIEPTGSDSLREGNAHVSPDANSQQVGDGLTEVQSPDGEIPERYHDAEPGDTGRQYPDWSRNWQEVAFTTCDDAVDDGLSRLVDGVPQSYPKWRQNSLKAYGNGIVPEVAMNIMQAIKESI